jgi:hypothetical protein
MKLDTIKTEVSTIVQTACDIRIENTDTLANATILLSELNRRNDAITTEKEKITRPLLDALAVERGRWKPVETQLSTAIDLIRGKMSAYQTQVHALAERERATIALRLENGTIELDRALSALDTIETPTTRVKTATGSLSFTTVKLFEIEDFKKLPNAYKLANETAIRTSMKTNTKIPGVRYFTEERPINKR